MPVRWPLIALLTVFLCSPAPALINPNFTVAHMTRQAGAVLELEVGPVSANGEVPVRLVKAIKGMPPAKGVGFDLSQTDVPQATAFRDAIGGRKQVALLFIDRPTPKAKPTEQNQEPDATPAAGDNAAAVHVNGQWFGLSSGVAGVWVVEKMEARLQGVWAGSTDMLLRGVQYTLTDAQAAFPVVVGAEWAGQKMIAALSGRIHAAMPVDLAGDGRPGLFLGCESGDRVLQCEPGSSEFRDITGRIKLVSRSQCAAWADFNADGRLDLASFDGKQLTLRLQTAAGQFESAETGVTLPGACIGLSALQTSVKGRAGLLVSTNAGPILLTPQGDGSFKSASLSAAGTSAGSGLGEARPCLVADFDNDGIADVLQPFAKGSLFYKGTKPGVFERAASSIEVATGPGRCGAFLGDFDADGLLDVFVAAAERCFLWRNLGGGRFTDVMRFAGEAAYISKPNGIGGMTCDINNDGRQDLLLLYADLPPQIFFSRGFASFGHAHQPIDLGETELLPAAGDGQQAGLIADLNGDGGQDMALALANGEVWVLFRKVAANAPAPAVSAGLPANRGFAGPMTVWAVVGKRTLGAWNLVQGGTGAFFGLGRPGPCTLRWRLPDGSIQEKRIDVGTSPAYVPIPGEPGSDRP